MRGCPARTASAHAAGQTTLRLRNARDDAVRGRRGLAAAATRSTPSSRSAATGLGPREQRHAARAPGEYCAAAVASAKPASRRSASPVIRITARFASDQFVQPARTGRASGASRISSIGQARRRPLRPEVRPARSSSWRPSARATGFPRSGADMLSLSQRDCGISTTPSITDPSRPTPRPAPNDREITRPGLSGPAGLRTRRSTCDDCCSARWPSASWRHA